MIINNCAILNFVYNYIDKNKPGVSNWINVPNTDPLITRCRNNFNIIISEYNMIFYN